MPITRVIKVLNLLKMIGWRCCLCFKWVPYIPGTTAQSPGAEQGPNAR